MRNDNVCIYCGQQIPEGMMVCKTCTDTLVGAKSDVVTQKYHIALDTKSDLKRFCDIVSEVDGDVHLSNGEGFVVSAKSFLGLRYAWAEWDKLYVVYQGDRDIYFLIKDYILED